MDSQIQGPHSRQVSEHFVWFLVSFSLIGAISYACIYIADGIRMRKAEKCSLSPKRKIACSKLGGHEHRLRRVTTTPCATPSFLRGEPSFTTGLILYELVNSRCGSKVNETLGRVAPMILERLVVICSRLQLNYNHTY
jgi:hypothetical protein